MLSDLSGIVINQNQTATGSIIPSATYVQTFVLPSDYLRGTTQTEQRYPSLTGFQLCIGTNAPSTTQITYSLQRDVFGAGWITEASGTVTGCHTGGNQVWMDVYYDEPVKVSAEGMTDRWRLSFSTNASQVWYSAPNPLAVPSHSGAFAADGVTALTDVNGNQYSFLFRVLGLTADEGVDFLGNNYRSAVATNDVSNVSTGANAVANAYWLSEPQPSKFAVVSLYFDQSDQGSPITTDALLLDPVTPGVYFSVYYSSDGDPATTVADWDNKLWRRIPKTFCAAKRDNYVFPQPVNARYFKIEFSHLQARSYTPGDFQQPIQYRKFPKWVLDYFMLRRLNDPPDLTNTVQVVWDALDLAYNYYLDDIRQEPDQPVQIDPSQISAVADFLNNKNDVSDQVDSVTLAKINLAMRPYQVQPGARADITTLLGKQVAALAAGLPQYPSETTMIPPPATNFVDVSSLNRDAVVMDQSMPVMFFFLTCRHAYREVLATFQYNKAYYAGVQEVAFTREHYTAVTDTALYITPTGDDVNMEYNDFVNPEGDMWVVYD